MKKKPYLISIEVHDFNDQTQINVFELTKVLDFDVKRVYTIQTGDIAVQRGKHAHLNQSQVICLLNGRVTIQLFSPSNKLFQFDLKNNSKALYIPPNYWIELNAEAHTTLLCLASKPYMELVSVYNKNDFYNQNSLC